MKNRSFWHSLFRYKCPKCRQGDLFVKPFQMSKPLNMPATCSHCSHVFAPEPGYFWGAMFISYIIASFSLIILVLTAMFGLGWTVMASMLFGLVFAGLFYFKLMRFSRSLWIHMLIGYDPDHIEGTT